MAIEEIKKCDINNEKHSGKVFTFEVEVIFDHDQEDGKSKCNPYLETKVIEMCEHCRNKMLNERKYVYGYGAMGFNSYKF